MKNMMDQKQREEKRRMKKYAARKPYMILGFGITAFFDLIRVFIWLFLVLSLLSIPAIFIF